MGDSQWRELHCCRVTKAWYNNNYYYDITFDSIFISTSTFHVVFFQTSFRCLNLVFGGSYDKALLTGMFSVKCCLGVANGVGYEWNDVGYYRS